MKVALGVAGGIAAYKAAEIVRLLQERGIRVQVVMTEAAQEFIKPLAQYRLCDRAHCRRAVHRCIAGGSRHC